MVRRVGSGAEGTVYLAEQGTRRLALKRVGSVDPGARDRLAGEFLRLSRLAHPNLVAVHDLETVVEPTGEFPAGALFFTADFIEGSAADEALGALGQGERVGALLAVAEDATAALAHIHAAGLLHADVKPANLLVAGDGGDRRAVLVDLGLSTPRGAGERAAGTPIYMAPEALGGWPEPRSDLHALGATLAELASGAAPRMGDCTPVGALAPWLPRELADLIDRMRAPDPDDRPSSALVVLDHLARVREALGIARSRPAQRGAVRALPPVLLPPRLIGRTSQLTALSGALARAARGQRAPAVVRLCGPPGAGRSALVTEAVRRHQLGVAAGREEPIEIVRGDADSVLAAMGAAAVGSAVARAERGLMRMAELASGRALAIVLEGEDPIATAMAHLAPHHPALSSVRALVIAWAPEATPADPDAGDRVLDVATPPLADGELALLASSMLGRAVRPDWARELARVTAGLPGLAAEVVRAAAQLAGAEPPERVAPGELLSRGDRAALGQLVCRRAAALPQEQAQLLEAAAVCGPRAPLAALAAVLDIDAARVHAGAGELAARGFGELQEDALILPDAIQAAAVDRAIPVARRRALHRAALRWLEQAGQIADPVAVASHLVVTGPGDRAARAAIDAAVALAALGRGEEALAWAERASSAAPAELAALAHVVFSERAAAVGRYPDAIAAAQRAARARDPELRRRAQIALARAQQLSGDLDAADGTLARLRGDHPDDDEVAAAAARLHIARARYREAAEIAGAPSATPPRATDEPLSRARAMRLESAGLARLYLGEHDAAEAELAALEAGARAARDRSRLGRALGLRGMAAQVRGDVAAAALLYAQASAEARAAGDVHAAAVHDLNQATAHAERARHGLALVALTRATAELRALGDVAELSAAIFNRGIALVALGELPAARRAAEEARARAEASGTPEMEAFAHQLDGDVSRREGDAARAEVAYRRALDIAARAGLGRARMLAQLSLAETLAESGRAGADEALAAAAADAGSDDDRDRLLCARARVALASGRGDRALADELAAAAERGRAAGRLDLAWRADALSARLYRADGELDRAAEMAARARGELGRIASDTPEAHRPHLAGDPDAQALGALEGDLARAAAPAGDAAAAPSPRATGHLRRLLALSRRLNSELRLAPLLDDVIDTAIELTSAERGFLLVYPPGRRDQLDILVARNIQDALAGNEVQLSRSIAERAARTGEVQLTVDAAFDERFGGAESVAALHLRSVLAVPLRQKGRVVGTIYVDHRFRRAAFDDEAVELACELADIAAVAIENARLVEENRQRQDEIAALNQRLSVDLGDREAELLAVKAQLVGAAGDDRAGLRHAYAGLIGRSPAMVDLLRALDRMTESSLPVVLSGESGTGKELVARALHEHGPRRERAFVAVNCGALPEPLLESELFGHVRGAFTGADRDRRGLFEVAHTGTLFLDEVADTSLPMQTKLLRVLQEREIRRVGDERTREVDVRIIAASNRDLEELVAKGEFREDLFYRLNVLRVKVPPLRERVPDVPALVEHILARVSRGEETSVSRAALARLCAYAWPGNVRELENEIARAAALADGVIDVANLSPHLQAAVAAPAPRPARTRDLVIKPQIEALERLLVEEAMRRTSNNQTAAARLLGLSRFGLQKKLRRYGLSAAD